METFFGHCFFLLFFRFKELGLGWERVCIASVPRFFPSYFFCFYFVSGFLIVPRSTARPLSPSPANRRADQVVVILPQHYRHSLDVKHFESGPVDDR